ncbi:MULTISPECIES: GNAT family N-acetyltransferase [Rhodococcus]|uniref:GNAT family N-acetyltransferase n=1 Tax=Rhodococcus TaxID=1827 RepID=UPI00143EBB02|nr:MULTISPECIES: GNAT family N-acetyltransferase [Rhodococcus]MBC2588568.1 GNAT family N-acetyltransferase [Rhodococcus aetherivorans]QIX51436.1 GNAT family N-acetyltransferase [Rhodococcus sp. DMU1]QSE66871.1 GNAT family N-acetyltransferase [Rhodococcus sp. PSBB049]USC13860.1 GNAT family N-acetyltransferase [Rhodococcus sp. 11-3]WFS15270.1 GNAT family N-acetyltransferase [Rhodococcus aetherivorans]
MQIEPRPIDDAEVQSLIDEVQLEYVRRYGGPDHTSLHPEEFTPPHGVFLLARGGGAPAGIGGWRARDSAHPGLRDGDAEIKRMYVREGARRRGVARRILAELERTAVEAGRRRMVLETGTEQPEALAMYAAAGYEPLPERFGKYAYSASSLYFFKDLALPGDDAPRVRPALAAELPVLQDIERAAGRAFADLGMDAVAADPPPTLEELHEYVTGGRAWVCLDGHDRPVAYLLADVVDGTAHIEQVSVHPDHARRGLGRALIDHLAGWARVRELPALTLTTFADVPWNGPYYRRLGFRYLRDDELGPGLRQIRRDEAAGGMDRWPRAAMRREL